MNGSYSISGTVLLILLGLAILLLSVRLHKIMEEENNLDWWQFISTRAENGQNYADIDKLGKVVGIFVGSWTVIYVCMNNKVDLAVVAFYSAYLAFVGGVAGYSAYLRSKRGVVTESHYIETTSTASTQAEGSKTTTEGKGG